MNRDFGFLSLAESLAPTRFIAMGNASCAYAGFHCNWHHSLLGKARKTNMSVTIYYGSFKLSNELIDFTEGVSSGALILHMGALTAASSTIARIGTVHLNRMRG